ncbi:MAG TPA: hypothetical protein VK763_00950 [Terriglobales bacterium]|jgi:hypothetical protein|nr:hypothetical protein [Terriglobales bacterium]
MEALTRLVADSLARHGFDRPVDPRRLQWSRWFRCDSTHSLLVVPSKPGIFALAEDIMDLGTSNSPVGTAVLGCRAEQSSTAQTCGDSRPRLSDRAQLGRAATAPGESKRMLAVLQFSEDDDMAFTLDRMFTCANPMRARLASGRCFLRFVVIEDQIQRRNICNALNQWMHSSAEKASGIGIDFQSSLEFTDGAGAPRVGRTLLSDNADSTTTPAQPARVQASDAASQAPNLDSGANKNLHCPHPLPSGF